MCPHTSATGPSSPCTRGRTRGGTRGPEGGLRPQPHPARRGGECLYHRVPQRRTVAACPAAPGEPCTPRHFGPRCVQSDHLGGRKRNTFAERRRTLEKDPLPLLASALPVRLTQRPPAPFYSAQIGDRSLQRINVWYVLRTLPSGHRGRLPQRPADQAGAQVRGQRHDRRGGHGAFGTPATTAQDVRAHHQPGRPRSVQRQEVVG